MKITFKNISPYVMILPVLLITMIVVIYPLVDNIILSFYNLKYGTEKGIFIGLDNYIRNIKDPRVLYALVRSIAWTAGNIALITAIGLGGALLLSKPLKGTGIIRSIIILPWVIPTVVVSLVWRWILEPDLGIINNILYSLGLMKGKPITYLGTPDLAMLSLVLINSWKLSPFAIVVVLAALQTIPRELYEAAMIDGASSFTIFKNITMPLISPILTFLGFIGFAWCFNTFDLIWLITEGGPGSATETLPILIYRKAFLEYRLSEAASLAVIMFIIVALASFLILRRR